MAFTSSTCSNGYELQTRIKNYLTTNGWNNLKDTGDVLGSPREMIFQNPDQSVCIGFISSLNTGILATENYFNLRLNVFDSYNSSVDFYSQPGSVINTSNTAPAPMLITSFEPLKYWFILNERRLIIITYAEQTYAVSYLGKFLPHGSPEQYTKPFICGGTGFVFSTSLKNNETNFRNFFECGTGTNNYMLQVKNHLDQWKVGNWRTNNYDTVLFPTPYTYYYVGQDDNVIKANPTQVISGEYTLGILDGFYSVERFNLSAETIVTIKNEDNIDEQYIAFPNSNVVNSNYKTYYLIKLK